MEAELPLSTTVKLHLTVRLYRRPRSPKGQAMDCINFFFLNELIVSNNLQKEVVMKIDTTHSVNCDLRREENIFLFLRLGKHTRAAISLSCEEKVKSSPFDLLVRYSGFTPVFFLPKFFQECTTSKTSYKTLNK